MAAEPSGTFVEIMAGLLHERRLTQRQLCDAVGVDKAHMSRILRRRATVRPSAGLLERIADALDIDPVIFSEYREWRVIEAVRRDARLRERIFAAIHESEPADAAAT